uniref:Unannotated protein n=1 Tax=freshwater metagenome TaxID=449393 RepID=A0A6J7N118_9ZZZZ
MEAIAAAVSAGCRVYGFTSPVPIRSVRVAVAIAVIVTKTSRVRTPSSATHTES